MRSNGDYEFGMFVISLYLERNAPEALEALQSLPWVQDGLEMTRNNEEEFNSVLALTGPVATVEAGRFQSGWSRLGSQHTVSELAEQAVGTGRNQSA